MDNTKIKDYLVPSTLIIGFLILSIGIAYAIGLASESIVNQPITDLQSFLIGYAVLITLLGTSYLGHKVHLYRRENSSESETSNETTSDESEEKTE